MMKAAGAIRWVRQAGKAGFAFEKRLKPAPVARGVDEAASTSEVFIVGRPFVSAQDHGVAFCNDAEIMPDGHGGPGCRPPPVDVPLPPIAREVVHSSAKWGGQPGVIGFRYCLSSAGKRKKTD